MPIAYNELLLIIYLMFSTNNIITYCAVTESYSCVCFVSLPRESFSRGVLLIVNPQDTIVRERVKQNVTLLRKSFSK